MFLTETSSRTDLEIAAIEADLDLDRVAVATDSELLEMIRDWAIAGDECGSC